MPVGRDHGIKSLVAQRVSQAHQRTVALPPTATFVPNMKPGQKRMSCKQRFVAFPDAHVECIVRKRRVPRLPQGRGQNRVADEGGLNEEDFPD